MRNPSLTKKLLGTQFLKEGLVEGPDSSLFKAFEMEPLPSGILEVGFDGAEANSFFTKISELIAKLPNLFEGQILLKRSEITNTEAKGFVTKILIFEKVNKAEGYTHLQTIFMEMGIPSSLLSKASWNDLLSGFFGTAPLQSMLPDIVWEKDCISTNENVLRALSLTELPQLTWRGCLNQLFESSYPFTLSIRLKLPDNKKTKRQLETKRRVSHALSITSSLEIKNIESNSVLYSSEETLERILVGKETLFEISLAVFLFGERSETLNAAKELERIVAGVGNAGLYLEGLGTLPVVKSHIPGNQMLGIRKLPILSENLSHILPVMHDYSRKNASSSLDLRSRSGEKSHLNLFSPENLNFNSFICGASGSGKSFLMNAILASTLKDESHTRICIFDVGGSYRKIVEANQGKSKSLTQIEARSLIASFLSQHPVSIEGFFRTLLETLCGSGAHITHSHSVAIDDLLKELEGERLEIKKVIELANKRSERFYLDIAHWLKPHVVFDNLPPRNDLIELLKAQVSAFDFKELDSDPILQRTTILLMTEILWLDLGDGRYPRT